MKKLLIADDEANLRLLVAATLESSEYEILEARDGREALQVVREQRPELVLLDVMMPELDGLAVCRAIKGDPELAQTTVVMLTAKGQEHDRMAGRAAGADDYFTKPFSPLELLALVDRVLRPELAEVNQLLRGEEASDQ